MRVELLSSEPRRLVAAREQSARAAADKTVVSAPAKSADVKDRPGRATPGTVRLDGRPARRA